MKPLRSLVLFAGLLGYPVWGQNTTIAARQFFEGLTMDPPAASVSGDRVNELIRPLLTATPAEVAEILPAIRRAAKHSNAHVQLAAMTALVGLSAARMDSATLLSGHLDLYAEWMNRDDARTAQIGLSIISWLKPIPPPEATQLLLRFAERLEVDSKLQAQALAILLRREAFAVALKQPSQGEQIIPAVQRFARRQLDTGSRIVLLDGIASLQPPVDQRLSAIVFAEMNNEDASVRIRSLNTLMRLGPGEVRKVALEVERLRTQDPNPEVRSEADRARVMGGEDPFQPGRPER